MIKWFFGPVFAKVWSVLWKRVRTAQEEFEKEVSRFREEELQKQVDKVVNGGSNV